MVFLGLKIEFILFLMVDFGLNFFINLLKFEFFLVMWCGLLIIKFWFKMYVKFFMWMI